MRLSVYDACSRFKNEPTTRSTCLRWSMLSARQPTTGRGEIHTAVYWRALPSDELDQVSVTPAEPAGLYYASIQWLFTAGYLSHLATPGQCSYPSVTGFSGLSVTCLTPCGVTRWTQSSSNRSAAALCHQGRLLLAQLLA